MRLFETKKNHENHQVFYAYHSPFAVLIDTVYTSEKHESRKNIEKELQKVAQSSLHTNISVLSSPRLSREELTIFLREIVSNVNDSLLIDSKALMSVLEL